MRRESPLVTGIQYPPPPQVCMDGVGVPVDIVKDIEERFIGRGSKNWGNYEVWEEVHYFSTEVATTGCEGPDG